MLDKTIIVRKSAPVNNHTTKIEDIPDNIAKTQAESKFARFPANSKEAARMFSTTPCIVTRTESEWIEPGYPNRPYTSHTHHCRDVEVIGISHTFDKQLIVEYRYTGEERRLGFNE